MLGPFGASFLDTSFKKLDQTSRILSLRVLRTLTICSIRVLFSLFRSSKAPIANIASQWAMRSIAVYVIGELRSHLFWYGLLKKSGKTSERLRFACRSNTLVVVWFRRSAPQLVSFHSTSVQLRAPATLTSGPYRAPIASQLCYTAGLRPAASLRDAVILRVVAGLCPAAMLRIAPLRSNGAFA